MRVDQLLLAVAPRADPRFVHAAVACDAANIMRKWGLTDAVSQKELVGQMAAESGGFRIFAENLSYSADRLHVVWPNRYHSVAEAEPYARNPKGLALNVYNGRMGNRPGTTDGWDYRGSNALEHTGRAEFERVTKRSGTDVLSVPDRLRDIADGALTWNAACSFFVDRGALAPARAGQTRLVTQKVNGGLNGLADRIEYAARGNRALGGQPLESGPATSVPAGKPPEPTPPVNRTIPEEVDKTESDKKTARNAGTVGTVGAGPAASMPQSEGSAGTLEHWAIVVSAMIVVGALALLIYRAFSRRHAAAVVNHETQQLAGLVQRVESST